MILTGSSKLGNTLSQNIHNKIFSVFTKFEKYTPRRPYFRVCPLYLKRIDALVCKKSWVCKIFKIKEVIKLI